MFIFIFLSFEWKWSWSFLKFTWLLKSDIFCWDFSVSAILIKSEGLIFGEIVNISWFWFLTKVLESENKGRRKLKNGKKPDLELELNCKNPHGKVSSRIFLKWCQRKLKKGVLDLQKLLRLFKNNQIQSRKSFTLILI